MLLSVADAMATFSLSHAVLWQAALPLPLVVVHTEDYISRDTQLPPDPPVHCAYQSQRRF